ncbi:MAG TPA: hypothetical protein VHZ03_15405 [Trebonia sp.]|nr:hypothetical protein [Trebonia sp.]
MYNRPIDLTWQHTDHALANRWSGLMTALFAWLQCLEANPQPGYSMYDRHLDFQISRSLADLLRRASA